jgi:hypothetical protein
MMAVGSIASKMLGFADEVMEGFAKGIGDAGTIKASVNKMRSNMTTKQVKNLSKVLNKNTDDTAKAISKGQAYFKNTRQAAANAARQAGDSQSAQRIMKMQGMRVMPGNKAGMTGIGKVDRVAGISAPTFGNRLGDAVGGGIKDTITGMKNGRGFGNALNDAYTQGDKLRMDRVAGTFFAATAAGRVATGGGLYKDRNGSTNIIGIPFI